MTGMHLSMHFFPPFPPLNILVVTIRMSSSALPRAVKRVCRFLDKGDTHLTGNLHEHAKTCWGDDVFWQVLDTKSVKAAHEAVNNYAADGSITMAFDCKNKIQKQFSHWQHTKWETR